MSVMLLQKILIGKAYAHILLSYQKRLSNRRTKLGPNGLEASKDCPSVSTSRADFLLLMSSDDMNLLLRTQCLQIHLQLMTDLWQHKYLPVLTLKYSVFMV